MMPSRTLALDVGRRADDRGTRGSVQTQPTLTPSDFAAKWKGVQTTEKAATQEHFIDLRRMLGDD